MKSQCRVIGLWLLAAVVTTACLSSRLIAQVVMLRESEPRPTPDRQIFELGQLKGAPEPDSALKYIFAIDPIFPRSGNAAFHYLTALSHYDSARNQLQGDEAQWDSLWLSRGTDLPLEEVAHTLDKLALVRQAIQAGAECQFCDWNTDWRDHANFRDLIAMNLETQQRVRQLMRLLSLETNYALAVGDFDRAARALTCQFEIAKDVQNPELLVTHLIGLAGNGIAFHDCHTWIAQPNSPNLYWALTSLDAGSIGGRSSYLGEVRLLRYSVEAFQSPENLNWDNRQWIDSLTRDFSAMAYLPGNSRDNFHVVISAMIVRGYPLAKQRLIDEGWDAAELDRMPSAQVFCICESRNLARAVDDILKWSLLSPSELAQATQTNVALHGTATLPGRDRLAVANDSFLTPLIPSMIPAFTTAEKASERVVVMLAGLRTVEALRMHVAETGEVPASLAEIHIVPVPNDPRTGEPFPYHVTDDVVEIVLPDVSYNGSRDIVYRFERLGR